MSHQRLGSALWDRLGISISVLCVLHCVGFPLLAAYFSSFGLELLPEDFVHRALLVLLIAVGLLAFIPGFRVHQRLVVLCFAALGFVGIFFAAFWVHALLGHEWELPINVLGSLCLIIAHTLNYRERRRVECC